MEPSLREGATYARRRKRTGALLVSRPRRTKDATEALAYDRCRSTSFTPSRMLAGHRGDAWPADLLASARLVGVASSVRAPRQGKAEALPREHPRLPLTVDQRQAQTRFAGS